MGEQDKPLVLEGSYVFANQDLYAGNLNIFGKPKGRGIMYYYDSGECDVGIWEPQTSGPPRHVGEGVRYTKDREEARKLVDGQPADRIRLDQALTITDLEELPNKRSKDTIPAISGYDPARHKALEAWYNFRLIAGMALNDTPYGPSPYPPQWKVHEPPEEPAKK
eukprot:gnl/MRDRNA2_/MRDRNA2_111795_c0_seq1.p1 gnl/MRDRNA2_/MRDRNA2_111795_c0~~gnl/MRDRNA2_/MRDRNA2_111795_c0_seq1.p1  ORF type:complete len:165 (-),score=33.59 gnl/MRDRNA2_/MRDRNA2_111795_c0_seq1:95-589(-)